MTPEAQAVLEAMMQQSSAAAVGASGDSNNNTATEEQRQHTFWDTQVRIVKSRMGMDECSLEGESTLLLAFSTEARSSS